LELVVTKEAMPLAGSTLEPGSLITYSLTYENPSLAYANHPMLTDTHDVHDSYDILSNDPPPNAGPSVWDLGVLAPGAQGEITIVVRLSDTLPNNWIVSNQASLKSPESSITFSDVATHLVVYEGVDLTDLIVEEIRWEPADPEPQQPVQFYATVANTGTLDATDPFWVSLYIKPSPSEPPFGPSDHDYGYCLDGCAVTRPNYLYYVGELLQGERVEAWFQGEDVVFPSGGFYDVYVQVDVAFDHPDYNWYWGVYPEANEYNNVGTSQTYLEGLFTLYLPLIRRD
jgi:hypothetical protein